MATNRRLVAQEGPDYYVTPAWGTRALITLEPIIGAILEPCCGSGEMAEILKETGNEVIACDLYDRGYGEVFDFFKQTLWRSNIITNPPFNLAEEMLDHALKLSELKVCFLLRSAFIESRRRWEKFYRDRPPTRVYAFSERLSIYPASDQRESGGTTSYAWFVWDQQAKGNTTELRWIAPR